MPSAITSATHIMLIFSLPSRREQLQRAVE
jgi:hypothetical protein